MAKTSFNQRCLVKDCCGISFIGLIQNEKSVLVDVFDIEFIHPGI